MRDIRKVKQGLIRLTAFVCLCVTVLMPISPALTWITPVRVYTEGGDVDSGSNDPVGPYNILGGATAIKIHPSGNFLYTTSGAQVDNALNCHVYPCARDCERYQRLQDEGRDDDAISAFKIHPGGRITFIHALKDFFKGEGKLLGLDITSLVPSIVPYLNANVTARDPRADIPCVDGARDLSVSADGSFLVVVSNKASEGTEDEITGDTIELLPGVSILNLHRFRGGCITLFFIDPLSGELIYVPPLLPDFSSNPDFHEDRLQTVPIAPYTGFKAIDYPPMPDDSHQLRQNRTVVALLGGSIFEDAGLMSVYDLDTRGPSLESQTSYDGETKNSRSPIKLEDLNKGDAAFSDDLVFFYIGTSSESSRAMLVFKNPENFDSDDRKLIDYMHIQTVYQDEERLRTSYTQMGSFFSSLSLSSDAGNRFLYAAFVDYGAEFPDLTGGLTIFGRDNTTGTISFHAEVLGFNQGVGGVSGRMQPMYQDESLAQCQAVQNCKSGNLLFDRTCREWSSFFYPRRIIAHPDNMRVYVLGGKYTDTHLESIWTVRGVDTGRPDSSNLLEFTWESNSTTSYSRLALSSESGGECCESITHPISHYNPNDNPDYCPEITTWHRMNNVDSISYAVDATMGDEGKFIYVLSGSDSKNGTKGAITSFAVNETTVRLSVIPEDGAPFIELEVSDYPSSIDFLSVDFRVRIAGRLSREPCIVTSPLVGQLDLTCEVHPGLGSNHTIYVQYLNDVYQRYHTLGMVPHAYAFSRPVVTSVSPASVKPGDVITISGKNFGETPVSARGTEFDTLDLGDFGFAGISSVTPPAVVNTTDGTANWLDSVNYYTANYFGFVVEPASIQYTDRIVTWRSIVTEGPPSDWYNFRVHICSRSGSCIIVATSPGSSGGYLFFRESVGTTVILRNLPEITPDTSVGSWFDWEVNFCREDGEVSVSMNGQYIDTTTIMGGEKWDTTVFSLFSIPDKLDYFRVRRCNDVEHATVLFNGIEPCRELSYINNETLTCLVPSINTSTYELTVAAPALSSQFATESERNGVFLDVHCPPGQELSSGMCENCTTGTYNDVRNGECRLCPSGHYCPEPSMSAGLRCPKGTSSVEGSAACKICEQGKFSDTEGAATCKVCEKGYACPEEGVTHQVPCSPGTFQADQGGNGCVQCRPGTYQDLYNSTVCKDCGEDTYNGEFGAVVCKSCPLGSRSQAQSVSANQCSCPEVTHYGDHRYNTSCTPCPADADCSVNSVSDERTYPKPYPGFWVTQGSSDTVYACTPTEACPGGSTDTCKGGYEDIACTECSANYYRTTAGTCRECPPSADAWVGIAIFVVLVLTIPLVVLIAVKCVKFFPNFDDKIVLAGHIVRVCVMVFSFMQVMYVLGNLDLSWDPALNNFFEYTLPFGEIDPTEYFFNTKCYGSNEYIERFVATLLVPLVLGSIMIGMDVFLFAKEKCKRFLREKKVLLKGDAGESAGSKKKTLKTMLPFTSAYIQILGAIYGWINLVILATFECKRQDSSTYVFVTDPRVHCYKEGMWLDLANVSTAFLVVYSIGIPLLFSILLFRVRNPVDRAKEKWPAFLYDRYDEEYYWYELVLLIRKFALGVTLCWANRNAYDQALWIFMLLAISLVVHIATRPYKEDTEDILEFLIAMTAFLTLFLGVMLGGSKLSSWPRILSLAAIIAMLAFTGLFSLLLITRLSSEIVLGKDVTGIVFEHLKRRFPVVSCFGQTVQGDDHCDPLEQLVKDLRLEGATSANYDNGVKRNAGQGRKGIPGIQDRPGSTDSPESLATILDGSHGQVLGDSMVCNFNPRTDCLHSCSDGSLSSVTFAPVLNIEEEYQLLQGNELCKEIHELAMTGGIEATSRRYLAGNHPDLFWSIVVLLRQNKGVDPGCVTDESWEIVYRFLEAALHESLDDW